MILLIHRIYLVSLLLGFIIVDPLLCGDHVMQQAEQIRAEMLELRKENAKLQVSLCLPMPDLCQVAPGPRPIQHFD